MSNDRVRTVEEKLRDREKEREKKREKEKESEREREREILPTHIWKCLYWGTCMSPLVTG